jgi:hypothetical protein
MHIVMNKSIKKLLTIISITRLGVFPRSHAPAWECALTRKHTRRQIPIPSVTNNDHDHRIGQFLR